MTCGVCLSFRMIPGHLFIKRQKPVRQMLFESQAGRWVAIRSGIGLALGCWEIQGLTVIMCNSYLTGWHRSRVKIATETVFEDLWENIVASKNLSSFLKALQ